MDTNSINITNDSIKIESIKIPKSSKSSRRKPKDDNLSLSELEIMANDKKIKNSIKSKTKTKSEKSKSKTKSENHKTKTEKSKTFSESSYETSELYEKKLLKLANSENQNPAIRIKKNSYIFKLEKLGKKMSMTNTLDQLTFEYDKLTYDRRIRDNGEKLKYLTLMGIGGLEFLNKKYDPMGIDLEGWQTSMTFETNQEKFETQFYNLAEKYDNSFPETGPEITLICLIAASAYGFAKGKEEIKHKYNNNNININQQRYEESDDEVDLKPPPTIVLDDIVKKMEERSKMKDEMVIIPKKRGRPKKNEK